MSWSISSHWHGWKLRSHRWVLQSFDRKTMENWVASKSSHLLIQRIYLGESLRLPAYVHHGQGWWGSTDSRTGRHHLLGHVSKILVSYSHWHPKTIIKNHEQHKHRTFNKWTRYTYSIYIYIIYYIILYILYPHVEDFIVPRPRCAASPRPAPPPIRHGCGHPKLPRPRQRCGAARRGACRERGPKRWLRDGGNYGVVFGVFFWDLQH